MRRTSNSSDSEVETVTVIVESLVHAPLDGPDKPTTSKNVIRSTEEQTVPATRKRSASVNTSSTSSFKRQLRGRSVDVEIPHTEKTKSTGSTKSRTSNNSDKQTNVEDYSSSRRLTRRQAKMLEKNIGGKTNLTGSEVEHTKSKEYMDSTNSDEESSQESRILDSSISSRLRSKSSMSNTSDIHSDSGKQLANESNIILEESNPSATDTKIEPRKLRKTRLNSKDSDTSTISEAHSEMEVKKPGKIIRRTRSMTDEIERPNLRRSKRNIQKSSLPKMTEEPSVEGSIKLKKQKK